MVTADPCVVPDPHSTFTQPSDSPSAAGDAGATDAGATDDASPDASSDAGDASSSTAASPQKTGPRVDVAVTLRLPAKCSGPDAGSSPVAFADVTATLVGGATPETVTFKTDVNGFGIFHFTAPVKATHVDGYLDVAGIVTVPIALSPNP